MQQQVEFGLARVRQRQYFHQRTVTCVRPSPSVHSVCVLLLGRARFHAFTSIEHSGLRVERWYIVLNVGKKGAQKSDKMII
ncbi:hypothetical protein PAXRUDRAFT_828525 [Paxillus rubicundulus Ve08.2h10]|uniref:Uncharacterized protein n=1 Tax=Paxillus rubicundulus Ve08.2h10 TaxID=930991 RepID=A0A0D0D9X7_9AGAM|nr:hypothetical protein PAXRUDRAFT_828525 [Paxillus rubicundulus Ve08.2h10]